MVMLKLAAPLTEIEGSIGGNTYWVDQCGQHMREKKPKRDWSTDAQKAVRSSFSACTRAWSNHQWSQHELNLWWTWCWDHPKKTKKGKTFYYHPFLAFIHINMKRQLASLPITFTPQ